MHSPLSILVLAAAAFLFGAFFFWTASSRLKKWFSWLRLYLRDDLPLVNLERYQYAHAGYLRPLPGQGCEFEHKSFISSTRGTRLRVYSTSALGPMPAAVEKRTFVSRTRLKRPRGVLIFLPSLGHGAARCALVAQRFAEAGFSTYCLDLPTFGESEFCPGGSHSQPCRGEISDWRTLVSDVLFFAESLQHKYRGLPLFIGGHSLGGTVSLMCCLFKPESFKGLVLLSPLLTPLRFRRSRWCLKILASIVPRMRLERLAPCDMLSRNLAVEEHLENDSLFFKDRYSAGTIYQLEQMCAFSRKSLDLLTVPFHIQHGLRDLIAAPEGSRIMYHSTPRVSAPCKTLMWYHYCWHHLLLEPEADEILQMSIDFVEDRVRVLSIAQTLD